MPRSGTTADLVLHPVRLRVIQTLLGGRELTTAQIAAEMSDVSTATLYRHIAALADAGILDVTGEQRIRGAVERTFGLHANASEITPADLAAMTAEEHKHAFAAFVAGLLATFDRYVDKGDVDLVRDGVGYRHNALWLTDEELRDTLSATREVFAKVAANGPGGGRKRRMMSTVVIPDEGVTESQR